MKTVTISNSKFQKNWQLIFEDGTSIKIDLPYDAMIHEKRYGSCPSGDASSFFPGHKYVYQKEFNLCKNGNHYFAILFEGVYRNAKVFINDESVCFNKYGFSEFIADFSSIAREGKNILRVEVDNSLVPNARFYTGSGIYRPVSLIVKKEKEINDIRIKTIDYSKRIIDVNVDCKTSSSIMIFDQDE